MHCTLKLKYIFFTVCPPIQNCEHRTCLAYDGSGNKCDFCKYEHAHQRYERAYKYNAHINACQSMYDFMI